MRQRRVLLIDVRFLLSSTALGDGHGQVLFRFRYCREKKATTTSLKSRYRVVERLRGQSVDMAGLMRRDPVKVTSRVQAVSKLTRPSQAKPSRAELVSTERAKKSQQSRSGMENEEWLKFRREQKYVKARIGLFCCSFFDLFYFFDGCEREEANIVDMDGLHTTLQGYDGVGVDGCG